MYFQVQGDPHPWPRDGKTPSTACAIIVVDMQHDYCSPGYYMAQAGYDTQRLRALIPRIQRVLAVARRSGLHVLYTRHARVPDTARPGTTQQAQHVVTPSVPRTATRGEPGWQIVPALLPQATDTVIEKSTCSAFVSGELDRVLRRRGISHLALCGNTIDVCVHSTLRAAVDLDYECLLLEDCCGAVNDGLHRWAIESVKIEHGVFGTVASAEAFVSAFAHLA
jgi:nicotinamidase-related amidase